VTAEQIVFLGHRSIEGGKWRLGERSLYAGLITGPSSFDDVLGIEFIPVFVPRHANWVSMKPWTGKIPITNVLEYDKKLLDHFNEHRDEAT